MRSLRPVLHILICLALGLVNQTAWGKPNDLPKEPAEISVGMPSEFAALAQRQQLVIDLFLSDRRIGQFEVETTPSSVRFTHPDAVVAAIPDAGDVAALTAALSRDLDPNGRFLCGTAGACDTPRPDVAAIVFDQQRYRADLYINPALLAVRGKSDDSFLKPYTSAPGLVDTIGVALSGGSGRDPSYNLRNRAIFGVGDARLVSETSYSSGRGLNVDTLAGQLDRPDLRMTGGLYYATGAELIGRRRIVGIGIGSQFDTRYDRARLFGDQLVVVLTQRSRVDVMIDGRLVSSALFEAGNQSLDTGSLPDGSYPLELRIQEASGATRVERRFFTKSSAIAPAGHIAFHADAGLLAADMRATVISVTRVPLLSAGATGRAGSHFAWSANVMSTDRQRLAELSATIFTPLVQARGAILAAASGAYGFLLQTGSTSEDRLSFNFDFRHMHGDNARPLIPLDDYVSDVSTAADLGAERIQATGSTYTQIAGAFSYRIGAAQMGGSGFYRRDAGRSSSYAIGPSVRWPLIQRDRMRLDFDGAYARTNQGRVFAFGLNLRLFNGRTSFGARAAVQSADASRRRSVEPLTELYGSFQRDAGAGQQMSAAATLQRNSSDTIVQGAADIRGPLGYASANFLQRFGPMAGTQYGLNAQTTIAANGQTVRIGAQDQNDAVVAVHLGGSARSTPFEVLVDGSPRGTITRGRSATFSVPPYRRYAIRLRPVGGDLVEFDTRARSVDVFPGTVAALSWKADRVLAMFGRMRRTDGSAIANADIISGNAIAATDAYGYFQIQTAGDAVLKVHEAGGADCTVRLNAQAAEGGYTSLGDLVCRE